MVVVQTGANLGFAEGNNVGIRFAIESGSDYVLLLNNDTEVAPNLIDELLEAHRHFPNAGVIGPKIYYFDDPNRIWSAGGYWDERGQCFQQGGDGELDEGQHDVAGPTEFIVGCAMLVPVGVFARVGLLERAFFLNYEEIDFCSRVRKAGFALVYAPAARLWHKVSSSFGGEESPLKGYYTYRNRLLWARRHLPVGRRLRIASKIWFQLARRFLAPVASVRLLMTEPRSYYWGVRSAVTSPVNRALLCGVRDYLKGAFGPCPSDVMALHRRWKDAGDHKVAAT